MRNAEFTVPLLAEVYDAECPWGPDDDFFLSVVGESPGAKVLDLGCGTGRLTLALAGAGHQVTGVDPAEAALDRARTKARTHAGAEAATWLQGTSSDLVDASWEVAVMTSHVAQVFVTDGEWDAVLTDLHRALVPGGRLAFDTRDPADRAWDQWNPDDSLRTVRLPDGRGCRIWTETTQVVGEPTPTVRFLRRYDIEGTDELTSETTLRFRSLDELVASLNRTGWQIETVYGGWQREPVGHGDGELVVIATRAAFDQT